MRTAFSMIELVFIIVVIGILASVAVPKLALTRDDAKVANCVEHITIFMRDVSTYYTSQGYFSNNIKDMSDVEVYEITPISVNGDKGEYYFVCNKVKSSMTVADSAIRFKFSKVNDGTGNLRTNLNAIVASINQGTVDGDLGYILKVRNIASDGLGIDHAITGIRTKR